MNRIPISKTRAFDMVAYIMIQRNLSRTFILKSEEQVKESILLRQLTTAPIGYYRRHRNKFIVNKIKNRLDSFEIIRKPLKVKKVKKKVKK